MRQAIFVTASFLLGIFACTIYQYFFIGAYHPFPNFFDKYKYQALLTPQMAFERQKAKVNIPICSAPKTLILCYDNAFLKRILQKYRHEECENVYSQHTDIYLLSDCPQIAIARFGWGAPLNAIKLEHAIAWGVKQVIAIGTSCGLQKDISPSDILVCEKAIRDEGTSHHYLPYSKYAYPSKKLLEKLLLHLNKTNTPYKLGPSWTTDAFYRSTKEEVEQYQKEGVLNVEMEAASLFTIAAYRNIDMIALFSITDSYANLKWEKPLNYEKQKFKTMEKLFEITLSVATRKKNQEDT